MDTPIELQNATHEFAGSGDGETLGTINSLFGAGTAVIMLVMYGVTLCHVRYGSQYKAITGMIIMLMVSQIFGMLTAYSFLELNINGNVTYMMIWTSGIAFTMQQLPFNVSHFELAWIYRKLSQDVPKAIKIAEREG